MFDKLQSFIAKCFNVGKNKPMDMNKSYRNKAEFFSFFIVNQLMDEKLILPSKAENIKEIVGEQFLSFVQPGGKMYNLPGLTRNWWEY